MKREATLFCWTLSCRVFVLFLGILCALTITSCTKVTTESGSSGGARNPWTIPGVLRMGELAEPDNLNPLVGNQQEEVDLSMFWAGYLFNWSDDNQWVPELAAQVPTLANGGISKDGLTITYHLRKGVTWQDGAPFSADDVIYTWQQVMNPRNNVATKSPYDLVTHIDRLDPYTIVVHLKQPYAPFIAAFFSMGPTPYPVLPKHLLAGLSDLNQAAYNNMPIGTGPFKIVQYEKARFIKFEANPQYWRGPPKLKEILVTFIPDENTIVTQLRTHELDMERAADPGYVPTFQTIPGVKVHVTPFTSYAQMALNMNNPILADRTVRQALAYAIDKQAIINKAAHGVPSVANSDQPQFLWAYNPNVRVYQYNPVLARQMLDADGWKVGPDGWRYKNGQRLSLQFVSNTGGGIAEAIAEIAQRQWHDIGAQVEIKDYPASLLFATYGAGGIFQTGKFDIGFLGWANGVDPDDSTEFMCDQMPPAGQNLYHFCNRDLDAAERISLTSNSPSVRKAAYDKIQAILADEEPTIFVWFTNRVSVVNTDLKNYKPAHAVTTMWNPWEWEI